MYFIDSRGYLRKQIGKDFYIYNWDIGKKELVWQHNIYDLDTLVPYSEDILRKRNNFWDNDYVQTVVDGMKKEFYEDLLGSGT